MNSDIYETILLGYKNHCCQIQIIILTLTNCDIGIKLSKKKQNLILV